MITRQRNFALVVAVTTSFAMPVFAQTSSGSQVAAIPDFSGVWSHPAFPWFEPPASGPGPITNLSRWAEQRPSGVAGSAAD